MTTEQNAETSSKEKCVVPIPDEEDKRSILVVDDNIINLRLLEQLLTANHYIARLATNGTRALATIHKEPPDLILLDIMMPGMDGLEVCRQLKNDERTAHIPVLFISAINETPDKVKAFTLGAVDYISKPFQADEVLARVKTHLTLSLLQRQLEKKNAELKKAFDEIKILQGVLPICSVCKKIRNDDGYWQQLEVYIRDHSEPMFSHSLCRECAHALYPGFVKS